MGASWVSATLQLISSIVFKTSVKNTSDHTPRLSFNRRSAQSTLTKAEYVKSWLKRLTSTIRQATDIACPAVAAMKAAGIPKKENQRTRFDSDSKMIRIDNCASYSISHDLEDFVKPPEAIDKRIKGIGGTLSNVKQGTIKWFIEDDSGKKHKLLLPNGLYIPESPLRLLSPQHWAQVANGHKPKPNVTLCITNADRVVLKFLEQITRKFGIILHCSGM